MDEPVNAGDAKSLKKKANKDLIAQLADENDLRAILALPEGRRFLVRLFSICGYDENFLNPNNMLMCATAGRRMIASQVRDWIREIKPDGFKLWTLLDAVWQEHRYPGKDG
jgi:hypothetical protein